jgi:hypothetical protein
VGDLHEGDVNGARQFGIRDPNGYILYFIQPREARE